MNEMFEKNEVRNPINGFIYSLPLEKCGDEKLDWLIKNITANFYKLYSCSTNIAQVQKDYLSAEAPRGTLNIQMFSTNSVEYFFIKLGSIFELCYQVFDTLCEPQKGKNKDKHKFLKEEFNKYNKDHDEDLNIKWYSSVNEVRNRVVHGGYSIKTFTENGRILFQAYDLNLDEKLNENYGFFKRNSNLIYVDFYTNFYTAVVHRYIEHFFIFILYKLNVSLAQDDELSPMDLMRKNSSRSWLIGDEELFSSIAEEMNSYNA